LTVPPNPSLRQLKRVLVKAVAADLITADNGHFYLRQPHAEPLRLGPDLESARSTLISKWPDMVFIESSYARELILDEELILGRLETIEQSTDSRCSLFDSEALAECLCQTQIMLPRLRRMRTAAMQEEHL